MASRISQVAGHLNYPKGLLAGQVAIITGSGQGIGAEAARLFAKEGAKVVVSDVDAEKASGVAKAINESGGSAIAVAGDLLNDQYLVELVKKAAEFGNGKIHIIVNNAGFTWDGVIHKTTDKQWETILALHCGAPFKLVRVAAPYFRVKDGESRNIINISSTSGINGNAGQANYAVAKAGITGLTKTIAKEWGPAFGVRANTIAFGYILTRLTQAKEEGAVQILPDGTKVALGIPGRAPPKAGPASYPEIPLNRPGTATEAASSILAVASPLFGYVSGQTIMVTGGRNMSRQFDLFWSIAASCPNAIPKDLEARASHCATLWYFTQIGMATSFGIASTTVIAYKAGLVLADCCVVALNSPKANAPSFLRPKLIKDMKSTMAEFKQYMVEIYGNLFVWNLAGHYTTSKTLTYAMTLLSVNLSVQEWLSEEIHRVLGDRPAEKWNVAALHRRSKKGAHFRDLYVRLGRNAHYGDEHVLAMVSSKFLVEPKPAPNLNVPASKSTVNVSILDTTTSLTLPMSLMVQPEIANFTTVTCPSYSFLITHPTTSRKLIFDLGVRKTWEENPKPIVDRIKKGGFTITVERDVAQTLEVNGVSTKEIEAVIWSHYHWDHTGDPVRFPGSTALIVGPGFKERWPRGWPANPEASVREDAWKGRELREISFEESKLKIGRFNAVDYFGDGSFYLLNTPGHLLGHLCGLARTTADTFILMSGDAAHHAGEIRPTEYNPLPTEVKLTPNPKGFPYVCPGEIIRDCIHPEKSATKHFYSGSPGFNEDQRRAEWTIEGMEEFDACEDIFVVIAHDASLKEVVDFFPDPANEWKRKKWGKNARWRFLGDFKGALEKAREDGKL